MNKFEAKVTAVVTIDDDADLSSDEWNPTKAALQAYLSREVELARFNTRTLMKMNGQHVRHTIRELKDSMIHSVNTIEKSLARMIREGEMREEQGVYTLV